MSNLSAWLREQLRQESWTLREAEEHTGVSKTALVNILKKPSTIPTLETLVKLANTFSYPLWRLLELCGFNPGLPQSRDEQSKRIADLIARDDRFQKLGEQLLHLADVSPDRFARILSYIDFVMITGEGSLFRGTFGEVLGSEYHEEEYGEDNGQDYAGELEQESGESPDRETRKNDQDQTDS